MAQGADTKSFDYVVIGAGSAGCVLANRLSEDGHSTVCLIEAGPPDKSALIHVPMFMIWLMYHGRLNWNFETDAQKEMNGRRIPIPRGKTLGGSSSINGMVYIRGHRADYDEWAALGNPGWSYDELLPYFLKSERNEQFGDGQMHGVDGELNVTFIPDANPLDEAFVRAAEMLQYKRTDDFNGAEQDGFGLHQVTQQRGRRHSTAKAFLEPARNRTNLEVLTEAQVAKIHLTDGRATEVSVRANGGETKLRARREIVLAAGAIASPKILMLSGIGDGASLRPMGIVSRRHLPGVGRNLQDHVSSGVNVETNSQTPYGFTVRAMPFLAKSALTYLLRRRGLLASNIVEAGGFVRTDAALERPDIQFGFIPAYRGRNARLIGYGHGYRLSTVLLRPKSRGAIRLAANDPAAAPIIDARFFDDDEDLEVLTQGIALSRRILASEAFAPYGPTELLPGEEVESDDELRDYVRQTAATIFHPVGTCKMGNDDMAVVDERLRVRGVEGLRVADASIMPTIVGGNTNAPTIMIAEKAADMIREDARG